MAPWLPVETERLVLREFRAGDDEDMHEYAGDPEVARYMSWGPNDRSATRAFLNHQLRQQEEWPRDSVEMAAELKSERRVIGGLRLTIRDQENLTADIGYTFNRRHWNKGLATEAARALLDAAFHRLGLHRVWATCDARNQGSYRVMEKLGMRREALFLKDILQKGEWRDSYLYAVLREEWRLP